MGKLCVNHNYNNHNYYNNNKSLTGATESFLSAELYISSDLR